MTNGNGHTMSRIRNLETQMERWQAQDVSAVIPVYNVRTMYGARGDGSTDDATPIGNALTSAKEAGGGTVVLPGNKTYLVGSNVSVSASDNVTIWAPDGATIKLADNTDADVLSFTDCNNLQIIGVLVDGNKANQASGVFHGIQLTRCNFARVEGVFVSGVQDSGIVIRGCSYVWITNCRTFKCGDGGNLGAGIYLRDDGAGTPVETRHVFISNFRDSGSGLTGGSEGAGLQTATTSSYIWANNVFCINGTKYGLKLQGEHFFGSNISVRDCGNVGISVQADHIKLNNVSSTGHGAHGISVNETSVSSSHRSVKITNFEIHEGGSSGSYGLQVSNTITETNMSGVTLAHGEIHGEADAGMRIRGAVENIVVEDVEIWDCVNEQFLVAPATINSTVYEPQDTQFLHCRAYGRDTTPDYGFSILWGTGRLFGCWASGVTTDIRADRNHNYSIEGFNGLPLSDTTYPEVLTISGGVLDSPRSRYVEVHPESGSADDLDTITASTIEEGRSIVLRADGGDTITVKDLTGNIALGGSDFTLSGQTRLMLIYNGTNWIQLS